MTLKASSDSGVSWHVDTPIFAGHSAYSVVVPLIDATRVGVVYERGEASPYEMVTLAIVALGEKTLMQIDRDLQDPVERVGLRQPLLKPAQEIMAVAGANSQIRLQDDNTNTEVLPPGCFTLVATSTDATMRWF